MPRVHDGPDPVLPSGAARLTTITAALGLLAVCPAVAQEPPKAPEYRIKAAFLYNFTLYTEWPAEAFEKPDSPIILGVAGEDPFGKELDAAVRGKTVRGRAIEIHRHLLASEIEHPCHLLFVASGQAPNVPQMLQRLTTLPPLTVGESEDFTHIGGAIRFFVEENKVRFEVNTDAVARTRVKMSSKLLNLARIVRDSKPPGDR
jgi:hypothetical protein